MQYYRKIAIQKIDLSKNMLNKLKPKITFLIFRLKIIVKLNMHLAQKTNITTPNQLICKQKKTILRKFKMLLTIIL